MRVPSLGQKIPWRRKWQPTPVFLPGESHGQRSLTSYSPRGCKELAVTALMSGYFLLFLFILFFGYDLIFFPYKLQDHIVLEI